MKKMMVLDDGNNLSVLSAKNVMLVILLQEGLLNEEKEFTSETIVYFGEVKAKIEDRNEN